MARGTVPACRDNHPRSSTENHPNTSPDGPRAAHLLGLIYGLTLCTACGMSCPWPLDAASSRSRPAMRSAPPARCGSNRRATRLCSASASLPNPRIFSSPCIGGQNLSPTPFPPCWQWVTPILRPWFHYGSRIPGCPSPGARHTAGTPVFAPGIPRAARRAAPDAEGRYHYTRAEVGVPGGGGARSGVSGRGSRGIP